MAKCTALNAQNTFAQRAFVCVCEKFAFYILSRAQFLKKIVRVHNAMHRTAGCVHRLAEQLVGNALRCRRSVCVHTHVPSHV